MQKAKLFMNGKSQAVRLPKEFRFKGNEVLIKKVGNSVVLMPQDNLWQSLIGSLEKFSKDFMGDREQPKLQQRRYFK